MDLRAIAAAQNPTPRTEPSCIVPSGTMQRNPGFEYESTLAFTGHVKHPGEGKKVWVVFARSQTFYVVRRVEPQAKTGTFEFVLDVRYEPLSQGLDDVLFVLTVSSNPLIQGFLNDRRPLTKALIDDLMPVVFTDTETPVVVPVSR